MVSSKIKAGWSENGEYVCSEMVINDSLEGSLITSE